MKRETVLEVGGMTCGGCARNVQQALESLGEVEARVDLSSGRVTVRHDPAVVAAEQLVEAVRRRGFDAEARS